MLAAIGAVLGMTHHRLGQGAIGPLTLDGRRAPRILIILVFSVWCRLGIPLKTDTQHRASSSLHHAPDPQALNSLTLELSTSLWLRGFRPVLRTFGWIRGRSAAASGISRFGGFQSFQKSAYCLEVCGVGSQNVVAALL